MSKIKFKQTEIGEIPEGWDKVLLKDVAVVNEKTIDKEYPHSKIEYVDIASVDKGRIFEIKKLLRLEAPSRAQRIVRDNDILLSTVRPNLKHFAFMKGANPNTIASTGFAVISPKTIDPRFLYYYLTTDRYTDHLSAIADAHTSTYPAFNPDILENSEIPFPPENEQRAIAKILSDLDEKIELNHQMNKTLESIAQVIFKRWFVEFEFPRETGKSYKSSGGKMVDSELDEIPRGWKIGCISYLLVEVISGDWGKENSEDGFLIPVHCIRGTDIPKIVIGNKTKAPVRFIKEQNFIRSGLKENDIVVEISGGSPTQSTGRVALISKELLNRYSNMLICSNFCRVLRPKNNYSVYIFCLLNYMYKNDIFFQFENGTTGIKNLDINSFVNDHKIVIPTESTLYYFNEKILSLYKKIQGNGIESENIFQIRDSLLPRLMSGKIRAGR